MNNIHLVAAPGQSLADLLHKDAVSAEIPGWVESSDMAEAHATRQYNEPGVNSRKIRPEEC